jgi:hypothetical protein
MTWSRVGTNDRRELDPTMDSIAVARVAVGVVGLVLLLPLVGAGVLSGVFSTEILVLEVLSVAASVALTCFGLWLAFIRGRLREQLSFGRFDPLVLASALAVFAAVSFGALTGLLYLEGGLEISGWNPEEAVVWQASEFYLWHLADTVPFLDVPTNLQWEQPFEFEDRLGGVLLVIFTGIVILPLVQVARLVVGYRQPYEDAVVSALSSELPGLMVRRRRARLIGTDTCVDASLIGTDICVDVVREVWTEDALLRRLEHVREASMFKQRVAGYVLVAAVMGDRARERIEESFAQAPFPAMIVVWHTDEPRDYLASIVDGVRKCASHANSTRDLADAVLSVASDLLEAGSDPERVRSRYVTATFELGEQVETHARLPRMDVEGAVTRLEELICELCELGEEVRAKRQAQEGE